MPITLAQTLKAVAANCQSSFQGIGGVAPYSYALLPGGAGGSINASTGFYTAPQIASSDPKKAYDFVRVTDSNSDTATAQILVGTPLILLCDILTTYMGIPNGHATVWDQKIPLPIDSEIYLAVSVPSCRPFANNNSYDGSGSGLRSIQTVNMMATVDIDIISRGPGARDRKEEIILALNSVYSQQQQQANSFFLGTIPPTGRFLNLSEIDGAAIPYRYKITTQMQYTYLKITDAQYFDSGFLPPQIFEVNS